MLFLKLGITFFKPACTNELFVFILHICEKSLQVCRSFGVDFILVKILNTEATTIKNRRNRNQFTDRSKTDLQIVDGQFFVMWSGRNLKLTSIPILLNKIK